MDRLTHAKRHIIGVLSPSQEILVSLVVGTVIDHEAAKFHPAGRTPAQVRGHVGAVARALIGAPLKVYFLVEDYL